MTALERRILRTVVDMAAEGLQPRSYYLTPRDYRRLRRTAIDGRPVRVTCGMTRYSGVYANGGLFRSLRSEA